MKYKLLASVTLALTASFATAAGQEWMTDFSAAKEKAEKENKTLVVDFTGSDWCGWCIKLDEEVFAHEAFKKGVEEKFVLVELDFPQDKSKVSEAIQKQNAELQEKYQVRGFPTILLMDAKGLPFAQTGYQAGGPEKYVAHLNELNKEGETIQSAITSAAKLEGVKKAEAYVSALKLLPDTLLSQYQNVIDQVETLDPEDTTGFQAQQKLNEELANLKKEISNLFRAQKLAEVSPLIDQFTAKHTLDNEKLKELEAMKLHSEVSLASAEGKTDEALQLIDTYILKHEMEGEEKQQTLTAKMNVLLKAKKFDAIVTLLDEVIAIDPETEMAKNVVKFKTEQLPKMIENAKK